MIYDLINFHDPYTFCAESREVAALAVLLLGPEYGAETEDEDPEKNVPVFLLGGSTLWYEDTFGRSPYKGLCALHKELEDALETLVLGNYSDRRIYESALDAIDDAKKREEFIATWNDKRRTSLTDVGARARELAKWLREKEFGDEP